MGALPFRLRCAMNRIRMITILGPMGVLRPLDTMSIKAKNHILPDWIHSPVEVLLEAMPRTNTDDALLYLRPSIHAHNSDEVLKFLRTWCAQLDPIGTDTELTFICNGRPECIERLADIAKTRTILLLGNMVNNAGLGNSIAVTCTIQWFLSLWEALEVDWPTCFNPYADSWVNVREGVWDLHGWNANLTEWYEMGSYYTLTECLTFHDADGKRIAEYRSVPVERIEELAKRGPGSGIPTEKEIYG